MAIVFQTTFASELCADWTADLSAPDPCQPGDGITINGQQSTINGNFDQIFAAANNPSGGGGKGFRHYRGDGDNNNGGGINIGIASPLSEIWVRFYMLYSLGFAWVNDTIGYTKDTYWTNGHIFGVQGPSDTWAIETQATGNFASSRSWQQTMGGLTGDGLWHCYEYHLKQNGANGIVEIWIDDVRYLNNTSANLGSTPYQSFILGSNQNEPTGGGASDYWTDFDDVAVSDSGRIGPLSGGGGQVLRPPSAMRMVGLTPMGAG